MIRSSPVAGDPSAPHDGGLPFDIRGNGSDTIPATMGRTTPIPFMGLTAQRVPYESHSLCRGGMLARLEAEVPR